MIRLQAPAKVNLYLRVLGRRPDGYHDIETLFERIDLADELTVAPRPQGITVTCDDPSLDCGEANLVTQAARLLQQTSGTTQGIAIHLTKHIPIASGLGGGSSDAAATLVVLNQLWDLRLSTERLLRLATQLGSDVPFFLGETPVAIGRGRGDQCEALTHKAQVLWHVLVVPHVQLSTKAIYDQLDQYRGHRQDESNLTDHVPSITMAVHALRNGSLVELAKGLYNELEPEAIRRCPVIAQIQSRLRDSGCVGWLVSGSGPAVFGLCHDQAHANRVAHRLGESPSSDWRVCVVSTDHMSLAVGASQRA